MEDRLSSSIVTFRSAIAKRDSQREDRAAAGLGKLEAGAKLQRSCDVHPTGYANAILPLGVSTVSKIKAICIFRVKDLQFVVKFAKPKNISIVSMFGLNFNSQN